MSSYDIFMQLYAGEATVKYNCHSYAWYSQAINNQYWINDPYRYRSTGWIKSTGWTDTIPSGIQSGDRVDYYLRPNSNPHSALVYSPMLNLFSSKWGSAGLYVHCLRDYRTSDRGCHVPRAAFDAFIRSLIKIGIGVRCAFDPSDFRFNFSDQIG